MKQPYPEISYRRVFESLETIMGFPLTRKGSRYFAPRYLSGEISPRRDKMAAFLTRDIQPVIMIVECGGDCIPLYQWMIKYGGCADYAEAHRKLLNLDRSNIIIPEERFRPEIPTKYVYQSVVRDTEMYRKQHGDNFSRWLSGLVGTERAAATLDMYRVGSVKTRVPKMTDGVVGFLDTEVTIFWYINAEGLVAYDKRVLYNPDGHRNHDYTGRRHYKIDDGFNSRTLYGCNTLEHREYEERIFIVEAEKSAVLARAYYGAGRGIWLACGGMTNLRHEDLRGGEVLIADFDAWPLWSKKFTECSVPRWWETTEGYIPGAKHDIADMIEYIIQKRADGGKNLTNEEK